MCNLSVQCSMIASRSGAEHWQDSVALLLHSPLRGTLICVQASVNVHCCPALTTRATVMLRQKALSECKLQAACYCIPLASSRVPLQTARHCKPCAQDGVLPGDGSGMQWATCCAGGAKLCLLTQSLLPCIFAVFSEQGAGSSQASMPAWCS